MITKETRLKLVKLLNLSMSDNDSEALSALRMANKIVRPINGLYGALIGISADDVKESIREENNTAHHQVMEKMFNALRNADLPHKTREFVESVYKQWQRNGRISSKQEFAIIGCYQRNCKKKWP